jgi:hypothetical protein
MYGLTFCLPKALKLRFIALTDVIWDRKEHSRLQIREITAQF